MSDIVPSASVTPPFPVTDAVLTDCSVAEPDTSIGEVVFSLSDTYAKDALVISTTTHLTYVSAVDANHDNALPVAPATSNDSWSVVGPTNRWLALDLYSDTATVGPSPLTFELSPVKRVNTVVLDGLVGDSVTITQKKAGVPIWSYTQSLTSRNTRTWTEYLTGEFRQVPLVFRQDMLPVSGTVITAEVTRAAGNCEIASLLIGTFIWLGETETKAVSDWENFSTVTRDIGGHATMIPRRGIPKPSQTIWADKDFAPALKQARIDLDSKPAFWVGLSDGLDAFFGLFAAIAFFTKWTITPGEGDFLTSDIDLEGY